MKKSYKDVINETVEFYSNNPRAVEGGSCLYLTSEGNMCAVGRCLKPEVLKKVNDYSGDSESLIANFTGDGDITQILQEEYFDLYDRVFWIRLQKLHDVADNWAEKGLSFQGKDTVKSLLKKYEN